LNSTGQLYAVGELNGLRFRHKFTLSFNVSLSLLDMLKVFVEDMSLLPPSSSTVWKNACTGLSDSGKIWQWDDIEMPAMHIKFLHTDLLENSSRGGRGTVTRVVTGWDRASAYVVGTGIVYWDPDVGADYGAETTDGLLIDAVAIPGTSYQRQKNERQTTREAGDKIGEVIKHIVLEGYIVFITDLNRAFAVKSSFPDDGSHEVVELITVGDALGDGTSKLQDIQGSFRSFAVFTTTGEVLTADRNFLDTFWESKVHGQACDELPRPPHPSAATQRCVFRGLWRLSLPRTSLQRPDLLIWHRTSMVWRFRLGSRFKGAILRGVRYLNHFNDGKLVRRAYTSGHRIWFEPEKKMWLEHMADVSEHPEAVPRMRMVIESEQVNGEVSEWFEQEGEAG
jgi:SCF-associated factor 1